jgi:hypothetical protein
MTCPRCQGMMHLVRTGSLPEIEGEWRVRVFRCIWCGTVLGPVLQKQIVWAPGDPPSRNPVSSKQRAVKLTVWERFGSISRQVCAASCSSMRVLAAAFRLTSTGVPRYHKAFQARK